MENHSCEESVNDLRVNSGDSKTNREIDTSEVCQNVLLN